MASIKGLKQTMFCLAKRLQLRIPNPDKFQMPCFSLLRYRPLQIRNMSLYQLPSLQDSHQNAQHVQSHRRASPSLQHPHQAQSSSAVPTKPCPHKTVRLTRLPNRIHLHCMHCAPCCTVPSGGNGTFGYFWPSYRRSRRKSRGKRYLKQDTANSRQCHSKAASLFSHTNGLSVTILKNSHL